MVWFDLYETLEKINLINSDKNQILGCLGGVEGLSGNRLKTLFGCIGNVLYLDWGGAYMGIYNMPLSKLVKVYN